MGETRAQFELREESEERSEWVNVGEPPITGLKKKGQSERKERCEDVKINDPEKGLFVVADGVSKSNGWFASAETARVTNTILGEQLDRALENIAASDHAPDERKQALMDQRVRSEIQRAVTESNRSIKSKTDLDPRFSDMVATTLSLARLVQMPDGTQHLYVANVGDSRVFVLREGRLTRLTQDDSLLSHALKERVVTQAEAEMVDQANGADDLPAHLEDYFRQRSILTRAVGALKDDQVEIQHFQVFPGDRLVLASDGLTDQFKEQAIEQSLRGIVDDRAAERSLQTGADDMALRGTDPRAKSDDIAVVVHTIGEQGPDRTYVHVQEDVEEEPEITKAQVEIWRVQIPQTERLLMEAKERGSALSEVRRLTNELARLEYWVALKDLEEIQANTPARFAQGETVRVQASQNDAGQPWTVRSYNPQQDQYVISDSSGKKHQIAERFSLELWHAGDLVQAEDRIEMKTSDGKSRAVYAVLGEENGSVVLLRELPEGIERRLRPPAEVEEAIRAQFQRARTAKKQMQRAQKVLLDPVRSQGSTDQA